MANPIRMDKESLQALQGNNLSCPRDYSFLDKIDDAFVETNQLLNQAEDITGFGYISQKSRMHDIFMAYWELNTCIDTLLQEITEADNQLHKMVNDTANELERICLEDIEIPDTIHYYNSYEELPTLTINNFIQDGFVETNASVQGFVDLFDGVIIYGEDEMTLEEYVQYLEAQSVCTISYYSGEKANLNLLVTDLSMGVKDLFDGIAGYDIITGEHLSKQERTFKLWWGIGMMSFNLLMPAISGLRAQQAIGQKIYKWLDDIFLMEGVNPRILGGISQELAEQTARSGIQTISNKGLNTISRQITEESVEDAIQITAREGVETIGEHVVQEGMEDTVRITTREGVEDTIQTATREGIETFGQRITPEGIPTGSHPWESIYSGVKENAAILEKQVIQQEIYIPNRYDSTYGIRATEQQFIREGVETTLETASREGIEEMQEQAMREAAEAMESGTSTPIKYSPINICEEINRRVAESFSGATFTKRVLTEDTVMYRVSGGNAKEVGSYMSMTPQCGGLQSQLDLALNPIWGNTTENVTKVVVPKGTTIYEGIAAPQNIYDSLGNVIGTLPGGGNQVYIPKVERGWFHESM